ncbi:MULTISPECIES: OprD family porin [Stutzerimonas stutzeri subgroup]|uniref:Porin n=1 Tax=Stutzerimonas stutzeri CCUG 29243 TaxID=1196835 RepID=I4CUK5_STUST|nr:MULTISPECIES: OprD family porin [Stutzerimonas stutzeri subgroup]MBU0565300.1 OprD family porin [Gammaproteobacteria bacterium]AFM33762.1 porin [Stutzerimonas stutzeri CCUG 29243]MBU0838863.1 OprD family porin [Gammaproteobacteria bacterium]MBU1804813.1 OprD family porin [Gammaproteobacteria bacterium]MCQ2039190.1 OprD family porin [Stutzerimonas kunmingensis]
MLKTPIARGVALATLGATLAIPTMAQAAFIEDTKAGLELRNFYYNSDNRQDGASQSKQDEWAQGFLLRVESGYTEGTVGFGVDALGLLGVKLDSSPDRTGTGLLPAGDSGRAPDDYSELGLTAKAKVSKSVLKVGTLQLKNPAIATSDSRLLPAVMSGGQLVSNEIDGLTLDLGYIDQINNRNSTNYEDMGVNNAGKDITGISGVESDEFVYLGGTYKVTKDLSASYYYSNLEDFYKQHALNLIHVLPIADGQSLKTDLRYQRSKDDGNSNVDNKAFGAMVTYSISGHSFGLGYQKMSGDTGFAYVGGNIDPYLVNYVQIGDFAKTDEKSWQARYDFNFAAVGIPGLSFMTRYLSGDDFGANGDGKEWERDTDIGYTFQEGALKNLNLKWRNATFRTTGTGNDIDQNRLIVSYTIPLM